MIFKEWADKYGKESACKQFGLSDHIVFTVYEGSFVAATCGNWHGSEPLGSSRNSSYEEAIERLKEAVDYCFDTEETIVHPS